MNPLRRRRRDRRWTPAEPWPAPPAGAAHGAAGDDPLALPEPSVYVAVPPDDLGEVRIDVALDLAAFYNTLREGQISDEHALVLTQTFFPRGRWG